MDVNINCIHIILSLKKCKSGPPFATVTVSACPTPEYRGAVEEGEPISILVDDVYVLLLLGD